MDHGAVVGQHPGHLVGIAMQLLVQTAGHGLHAQSIGRRRGLIDQEKAALGILDENPVRHQIDDLAQITLAFVQDLLLTRMLGQYLFTALVQAQQQCAQHDHQQGQAAVEQGDPGWLGRRQGDGGEHQQAGEAGDDPQQGGMGPEGKQSRHHIEDAGGHPRGSCRSSRKTAGSRSRLAAAAR
nr:hypothetical protein [Thiohalobacter thiocyanaticus]